jgi:hypothetical protein
MVCQDNAQYLQTNQAACLRGLPACVGCLPAWAACLRGMPASVGCLPAWAACLRGMPACVGCLPAWAACLRGLPACVGCLPAWAACLRGMPASVPASQSTNAPKPDNQPIDQTTNSTFLPPAHQPWASTAVLVIAALAAACVAPDAASCHTWRLQYDWHPQLHVHTSPHKHLLPQVLLLATPPTSRHPRSLLTLHAVLSTPL